MPGQRHAPSPDRPRSARWRERSARSAAAAAPHRAGVVQRPAGAARQAAGTVRHRAGTVWHRAGAVWHRGDAVPLPAAAAFNRAGTLGLPFASRWPVGTRPRGHTLQAGYRLCLVSVALATLLLACFALALV